MWLRTYDEQTFFNISLCNELVVQENLDTTSPHDAYELVATRERAHQVLEYQLWLGTQEQCEHRRLVMLELLNQSAKETCE